MDSLCPLTALPVRADLRELDSGLALGRRWRHEQPGFWARLSPLGRPLGEATDTPALAEPVAEPPRASCTELSNAAPPARTNDQDALDGSKLFADLLARRRTDLLAEARRDLAAARLSARFGFGEGDLLPSAADGSMDDPEAEEERWR